MADLTKIATCSYCGTRSVLRLWGRVQHELACGACGARLHEMKHLRKGHETKARGPTKPRPHPPAQSKKKKHKKKRRKSGFFDLVEDVFDEIEDLFD
ncbi:MAG: hypothetical protein AAGE76_04485 [Pseudomonadota bacterium]